MFAGPYVSVLLNGHYTNTTASPNAPTVTESGYLIVKPDAIYDYGPFVHRYDVGFQGGVGYCYQRLLLQAGYSLGLRNVSAETFLPFRAAHYNRAFQASLSYLVGPEK